MDSRETTADAKGGKTERQQNSVIVRAAKATIDEGVLFAQYLDEAAEGLFRLMLGKRFAEVIATAYVQPDHDLSFQRVAFADHDGTIVGAVSGYTAEQHSRSSDHPLKDAQGYRAMRAVIVATICSPLLQFLDTFADDSFYLQAITVDRKSRSEGIGSILITFIEDRARISGSARLSLDVSAKNQQARKLYERRGMRVESESPRFLWMPGSNILRMNKTL